MTKLIALTQLSGVYGVVPAGHEFEVEDQLARDLLKLGYVKHATDPEVTYETQALAPQEAPELKPRRPFRHGVMRHAQPSPVDPENDAGIHDPDIRET
jgi:hypothetical protein